MQLRQPGHEVVGAVHDHAGAAVGGAAAEAQGAEDVLGVVLVVVVHPDHAAVDGALGGLDPPLRRFARLGSGRALLQDDDVGDDLGAGILLEGAGRQAERRHDIALLGELHARGPALLVHGAGAGDADDEAALAHLVHGLQEEVVVQRRVDLVVAPIGGPIRGERPVADDEIIEPVWRLAILVAFDLDVRLRVEQLRHPSGEAIELDAGQVAPISDRRRHHPEEVADAHGRFEDPAALEAHALHHAPHRLHGRRIGVVGIDDGPLRRAPLGLAQVLAEPLVLGLPPILGHGAVPCALE